MTNNNDRNDRIEGPDGSDPVARLLRHAGRRSAPPPDMVERIRTHVHAAWREELVRRRRRRLFAVAATVLTLTLGGWWATQLRRPQAAAVVASVERSAADFRIHPADGRNGQGALQTTAGAVVSVGDRLETGPERGAVLRIAGGEGSPASLRLAPGTRLVWQAPDRVELLGGQVYMDTGTRQGGARMLAIEAAGARIEHVGTRFLAALSGDHLDVKVREGTVRVRTAGEAALLNAGEQGRLNLDGSGVTQMERLRVDSSGEDWYWVDALAPGFDIENQSLLAVLQRAAQEGGLELRFESAELEREARQTVLHGPSLGMPPRQALDAVLVTAGFTAVPDGDKRLLVRRR